VMAMASPAGLQSRPRSGSSSSPLDTRLRQIGSHRIALGPCNECLTRVPDILRPSVVCSHYGFAVLHNHPSGDVTPSEADRTLTPRLREASALMGVRLVYHVVTTEPSRVAAGDPLSFSLREAGWSAETACPWSLR
jgi:DNA repair protein RadC